MCLPVARPREGVDLAALGAGDLGDDMRGSAEAVDAETRGIAGELQRAIADQPGAKQRRRLGVAVALGQLEGEARVGARVLGIAAVDLVAGEARVVAKILLAAPAIETGAVGMAQPRHADAIARCELRDALTERRHMADDLMAEHERELGLRKLAVENMQIGAADAAGRDLDEDLAGSRLGHFERGLLERRARAFEQHRLHLRGDGHARFALLAWLTLRLRRYPVLPASLQETVSPKSASVSEAWISGGRRPAIKPATKQL